MEGHSTRAIGLQRRRIRPTLQGSHRNVSRFPALVNRRKSRTSRRFCSSRVVLAQKEYEAREASTKGAHGEEHQPVVRHGSNVAEHDSGVNHAQWTREQKVQQDVPHDGQSIHDRLSGGWNFWERFREIPQNLLDKYKTRAYVAHNVDGAHHTLPENNSMSRMCGVSLFASSGRMRGP